MVVRKSDGALTQNEKKVVKALLAKGWRNQDIQALVNIGRVATINSARITEVKQNTKQKKAPDDEVEFFEIKKKAYDPKTGLNFFDDERLIRAREAMILAVQIFNSAALNFKSGVFSVLANIAWTYLLHEYYERKGVTILQQDGRTLLLSQMINRRDSPLSEGIRNNLKSLKIIRDDVEHSLLGKGDVTWHSLFQACCLNFEKTLCEMFGSNLTLSDDLSFALQFRKIDFDQLTMLNKFEIPAEMKATDARLFEHLTDAQQEDLEYQFRVVYTLDSSAKSKSHVQFVKPDSSEGKEIRNVLVQYKTSDHLYPHKPQNICKLVAKATGQKFTSYNHTQAWRACKVRPRPCERHPENTDKDFCIYHSAHRDYTYSEKWVEHLIEIVTNEDKFSELKETKLN